MIIYTADAVSATEWSPIGDALFSQVFGATAIAFLASMIDYLLAQYIDWKRLTKGRYLWLRNNFLTFLSQFVDTFAVLFLLSSFGKIEWELFDALLLSGFLFKVIIALLDTPLLYASVYLLRRRFGMKWREEFKELEF
ncbi:conserved hypothetical integral membrane protein [Salegentibacter flavus]|uniref:Queuosine precursor transporter n=1 Tax=Salegentibacter flavus TaxID=287099 RepID=A0A1I5B6C8_9FLAO|nr:conserved hypothetical integral membrane protein [Salegentibacter flavus]